MKRLASILGMLSALVAALLVIQPATAGAQPMPTVNTGPVQVSMVDGAVKVSMTSGTVKQVGNTVHFVNAKGVSKERLPLNVKAADGKTYPMKATVAANGKSVLLEPKQALTTKRPLSKPKNKDQAYKRMLDLANQNWPCAAPATIIGGIIGIFIPFMWWWSVALGAAIGAYVGYDNCGRGRWGDKYRGETIRAFWQWWNW